jgi:hypothetical protein
MTEAAESALREPMAGDDIGLPDVWSSASTT